MNKRIDFEEEKQEQQQHTRRPPVVDPSTLVPRLVKRALATSFSAASVTHSMLKTQL